MTDQTDNKLCSQQMAHFVARGFIRFDGIVPDDINQQFLREVGQVGPSTTGDPRGIFAKYGELMSESAIEEVVPGTDLAEAFRADSSIGRLLAEPRIAGAIESLVGPGSLVDHHFVHITFPPAYFEGSTTEQVSQHTHQDSTIDPRRAFDVQMFYFPHEVTADMGGTRFVPGTHLRIVSEAAIGRYQNVRGQQHVVCPAGTVMFMHHGIWHGGGLNRSERARYMYKLRLNPNVRQCRLWDTSDLGGRPSGPATNFFRQGQARPGGHPQHPDDAGTLVRERHRPAGVHEPHSLMALRSGR